MSQLFNIKNLYNIHSYYILTTTIYNSKFLHIQKITNQNHKLYLLKQYINKKTKTYIFKQIIIIINIKYTKNIEIKFLYNNH